MERKIESDEEQKIMEASKSSLKKEWKGNEKRETVVEENLEQTQAKE